VFSFTFLAFQVFVCEHCPVFLVCSSHLNLIDDVDVKEKGDFGFHVVELFPVAGGVGQTWAMRLWSWCVEYAWAVKSHLEFSMLGFGVGSGLSSGKPERVFWSMFTVVRMGLSWKKFSAK